MASVLPAGFKTDMEKEIEIKGVRLHYEVTGPETGMPLVLMHGWGCDHTTVASVAAAAAGMRVYNLDLPGFGQSTEPTEVWGVYEYADLVEEFIRREGIVRPVLAGHSYGGRVAIVMASRGDYNKVLLIDAAGIKPRRKPRYYIKVYTFKAMKKLLPLILGKQRGQKAIDAWRGKAGSADYQNSSAMMRAVMSRSVNQDLKHLMPAIKAPTLLVWGENDTATPLSDGKTMEKLIPDAGLVSFAGCGHYSFLDNPLGFKAVVREFLKKELNGSTNH